jgi:regulator of sigma E protease
VLGLSAYRVTPGFFEGIKLTFKTFWDIIILMFQAIGSLFTKNGFSQVGGPVQVYSVSTQMASEGVLSYIWFLAIISVNLGFFNLLPIPGLDGARFYISIGEAITNKKFNPKIESYINMIGMFFLFGLMIVVTFKDIITLF